MKKLFLFILLGFTTVALSAQRLNEDSLKNLLKNTNSDSGKIKLLSLIAEPYMWNIPDTAIKYAMQAWQLAIRPGAPGRLVQEPASVLSEALSAKGNYSRALEIDLQALQLADKAVRWKNYFAIGNVYFYSENYTKALAYYLLSYNGGAESKNDRVILGAIGEAYYHLGNLDSSYYFINESYQIDRNTRRHWSVPYFYLGLIHSKKKEFKEALDNYRLGLLYAKRKNLNLDIVNGSNGIADVFKQINETDSGIYYARQAFTLAQAQSLNPGVLRASSLLTELYLKLNTDSAFKYQQIMLAINDSLFSREKIRQLENISFNEKMHQQELQKNKEEFQNKIRIYGLITGLIFLLLLAFILYKNNLHKQRAYTLLQKQKREIDIQKAEVEHTLNQLKSTQSQLIQSEKMASLGELTAGIAHEIQNPLNFVNNFSDINKELLEELKGEADNGNLDEVKTIASDVIANEEKINHHGKRADAIVKGMLQHSRTSTGVKEPTDINALADEYLRLSYHGMRAKDKSFNCETKTEFDESLQKINVVPQDIGRVLLNLFNSAFYACKERSRVQTLEGSKNLPKLKPYSPTVTLVTRKENNHVTITVSDNGNGIPPNIKDKIFQPFFTTKPSGSGTGLGLSLSYDIIKAHGGEIKVESREGEKTEFIIHLNA